jgi:hypothetical protein
MYDIQGCIFKICRNFTYEVVGQRRRLKAIKKIIPNETSSVIQRDNLMNEQYKFNFFIWY